MNFVEEFMKGQSGGNKGIPLGKGFEAISKAINGIQKARIYAFAGGPKSGKTTVVDAAFVIQPILYILDWNLKNPDDIITVEYIYLSYEIDRVSKEFDFAVYFIANDYGIETITLPEGITRDGKSTLDLSPDYLRGRVLDDKGNTILIDPTISTKLEEVYKKRLIPIFGKYDNKGKQIEKGLLTVFENKTNPTGVWKDVLNHARENGVIEEEPWTNGIESGNKMIGYTENDPNKLTVVVIDHSIMWLLVVMLIE